MKSSMKAKTILLDQFHVTLEVDSSLDEATKEFLAKATKQELKECIQIARLGIKDTLIHRDRNKFKLVLSQ